MKTKEEIKAEQAKCVQTIAQLFLKDAPVKDFVKPVEDWFEADSYRYQDGIHERFPLEDSPIDAAKKELDQELEYLREEVGEVLSPDEPDALQERWDDWVEEHRETLVFDLAYEWADIICDGVELARDPYAYYGVRRSDFL